MLFSSITFLFVFLPLVLITYFICPRKLRNFVLLIFSLAFYAWGEPKYIIVMTASIIVGYISGLVTEMFLNKEKKGMAKLAMIVAVAVNLGILIFFKYSDFFILNFNKLTGTEYKLLKIALPLGISFYTFQILSYSVDVYRGEVKAQKNIINLAAYVTLFPQLIAGPIVRYQTVCEELTTRKESVDLFAEGAHRFVVGLGKKVLIANTVGAVFDQLSTLPAADNTVVLSWMSAIAFSLQIYFDFSGYSDMAIGLGKMFGFHFLENFNYPYISDSITEFWRRWHISLSTWFRDYVYIPLGGNRRGPIRRIVNIFVVWLLTGFWHGAAWNFIIWGLYYFVLLMLEKTFLLKVLKKLPKFISHIYTLFLVNLGWVIFAYDDMGNLANAVKNMFGLNGLSFAGNGTSFYLLSYVIVFVIAFIGATPLPKKLGNKIIAGLEGKSAIKETAAIVLTTVFLLAVLILSTAGLASDSFNPFLYFRF